MALINRRVDKDVRLM